MRTRARIDIELPICTYDATEHEDPMRAIERIESDDPSIK